MTIIQLFKNLWPYVKPYRFLVFGALFLTLIGSFTAQVNALMLQYTVDEVHKLFESGRRLNSRLNILLTITLVLLGQEILNVIITFAQKFYGEKLRIYVSRDLAQAVLDKILTCRMAFYTAP